MSTPSRLRVLVTGSAGRLGSAAVRALKERGHFVRGLDQVPTPAASESWVGSLSERDLLARATESMTALVHLAAAPDDSDEPDFFQRVLVPSNILGVHNILEAARESGIPRVVLASSGQVNWTQQYDGPLPVRAADPTTPRHWYAATKMFLESAGYSLAKNHNRSVIAARLGWCPRRGQAPDIAKSAVAQDLYFSPKDAGRFFERAVSADVPVGFHVLYAASLPLRSSIFELKPAMDLLQWQPEERWPTGAEDDLPPC
ncbi:MAG: NAD(P)-dependent oxidoreductase [Verrucomicrobia bacterium]|nr:NAD(P)-dependent oxidoreductase [Verrucomicrobiota bacterium]MBI3870922.1 NAD(P)-dependent oxidoreductase [Verrucomicrobiota bacterium]